MNTNYITIPYLYNENVKITISIDMISGFGVRPTKLNEIGNIDYPAYEAYVCVDNLDIEYCVSDECLTNIRNILNYRRK